MSTEQGDSVGPLPRRDEREEGFTLIELLVVLSHHRHLAPVAIRRCLIFEQGRQRDFGAGQSASRPHRLADAY